MATTQLEQVVLTGIPTNKRRDNDGLHKRRRVWHYKLKVGGRWREMSTRKSNYQEARKIRQQALQAQEEGRLPTDMAKWPFERAAAQWLASRENHVAAKTYRTDKERLGPLLKEFNGRRLYDIAGDDVRGYQIIRARQVGPRTINLETKVLRMILRTSKLWARVADDYKPLPENKRGPGRALSPEEEKRLFEVAGSNPNWDAAYYAAQLAANTTARSCELRGLRLADLDWEAHSITVRRVTTKTDEGCRVVPLNQTAAWAVVRLLERAQLLGATESDHYLFPARVRRGRPGRTSSGYDPTCPAKGWRTAWRKLTRAAELPGLRFHDLRHHSITRLGEAGVPEQTLMAIAGHLSRRMLEHYPHIRIEAKRAAVAALDGTTTVASVQ